MSLILSGTDGLSDVDGSAATPAIRGTDANTGIFFGTDIIGFSEGGVEAARFDSAGNFGLGVTPSAWDSTYKAIQVGARSMFFGIGSEANMANNAFYSTGYKYVATSAAGLYTIDANVHKWYNAASGTAGNAITFTQAMTLDASGNLGIGTTSPSSFGSPLSVYFATNPTLSIVSGNANAYLRLYSTSDNNMYLTNTGGVMTMNTSNTERMRIDSSGNVGIGTSTLTSGVRLISYNATNGGPATSGTTQASGAFRIQSGNNAACDFGVNGTTTWIQAADVTGLNTKYDIAINPTGGNLLVGTTNTSATAGVGFKAIANDRFAIVSAGSTGGTTSLSLYSTGASAFRFFVQDSGNINATSTSITAISDISLKENIRDLETGLNEVMALKPRRFDWKAETHLEEKNIAGFIAQELIEVLPELVYDYQYNATEIKKSIKMGDILPTLVKAIQEQQALILSLTARITALESN